MKVCCPHHILFLSLSLGFVIGEKKLVTDKKKWEKNNFKKQKKIILRK